jgi:hypothetical protein
MYRCNLDVIRVLGSVMMLAIFAAGCSGAGSSFTSPPVGAAGKTGGANLFVTKSAQKLYVANNAGGVVVYSTGSDPTVTQTITNGVSKPGGIWVDNGNIVYVVNLPAKSPQTSLPEYKPGATNPFRTIVNGIVDCEFVAVDDRRNVYVAGMSNNSFFLEMYPKGHLSPAQTLTIPHPTASRLSGLAFDSTGALLVGESVYIQKGVVYRLATNSHNFVNLNLQDATGGTIGVDGAGNLYVGSGSAAGDQEISVYPPNSTKPIRKIEVQNVLEALTVDTDGEMYVEAGANGQIQILVYPPGGNKPTQVFGVSGGGGGIALSR